MASQRILVVDDQPVNREVLDRLLRPAGYDVVLVESGPQALEELRRGGVDLVLLDVMMPVMSGLDVLRRIRSAEGFQVPVVMVTALSDSQDIVTALELGAVDYITKPIDLSVTLARVRRHLSCALNRHQAAAEAERLGRVVDAALGVWEWQADEGAAFYSSRAMAILGLDPGTRPEDLGAWLERIHPKDVAAIRLALDNLLEGLESTFDVEHRVRYGDGYRWVRAAGRSILDRNGAVTAIAGSLREVAEPADTDRLTGLSSPASFVTGIARASGDHQAILLLDVDGFGAMNRSLGQAHGDELLQAIARRLSAGARDTDSVTRPRSGEPDISVARLGGDEFAVLLNGLSGPEDAPGVARRLVAHVGGAYTIGGQRLFVTVSSGLAVRPSANVAADAVLRNAQAALHRAKSAADGSLVVFDDGMHAEECERFQIVQDLRVAIEEDQFSLEYQPIIDITTGGIREVEALVRWDHPTRGRLSPAVFIPRAEESGLIVALGEAVLSKVCRQLRSWREAGSLLSDLRVCVNVSPRQLAEPSICERFEAVLAESGVAASQIELEVTESSLMADPGRAAETLNRLRSAGFSLAIDDFGTGYSSLAYVRSFAVDRVKVDRAFLQEETPHVLETVVDLSHRLGMTTVAEGVETSTHVEQLQRLSCDFGQGYFLHRPLPPEELEAVLVAIASTQPA